MSNNLELRQYQHDCINLIDFMGGNCIIALDMGLGKTIISIKWCKNNNKKAIIVCPSNVKDGWNDEFIEKFNEECLIIESSNDILKLDSKYSFIVVSYVLCKLFYKNKRAKKFILENGFDTLIVDESSYLINSTSNRTIAVTTLSKYMNHNILLTGTPIQSKVTDIYPQIKIVNPGLFHDKNHFVNILGLEKDIYGKYNDITSDKMYLLQNMISGNYFCLKKSQVLDQLPPKIRKILWYEIKTQTYNNILDYANVKCEYPMLIVNYVRHELAKLMVKNTIGMVENLLNSSYRKIVLFTAYKDICDIIHERFYEESVVYNGDLSMKNRKKNKDLFVVDDNKRIFIATIQACAFGVNKLQYVADTVVFNDVLYVPTNLFQAEDRVYRMNQENTVYIYYMAFSKTYHNDLFSKLRKKFKIFSLIAFNPNQNDDLSNDIFNMITKYRGNNNEEAYGNN